MTTASIRPHEPQCGRQRRQHRRRRPAPPRPGRRHPDHRRHRDLGPQGHPRSSGPPRRSGSRSRGSATTRSSTRSAPAASASSRSRRRARDGSMRPMPKPQASCTITVARGHARQDPATRPTVADKAQQGVMELLLINHPLDCPVCDKGGECPLQNQAMSNGRAHVPLRGRQAHLPQADQHLLARCCSTASAACSARAARASPTRSPATRSSRSSSVAPCSRSASTRTSRSSRYFSGNTVQICPVGALTGAAYRFRSRPFDLVSTPSVCEHCAERLRRSAPTTDAASCCAGWRTNDPDVNEEWNCDKGRWAFAYATSVATASSCRWSVTPTASCASRLAARRSRRRPPGCARAKGAGVLVGGRVIGRGRLRLRQVRPNRARHQRHRLPRPPALGRGGRLPRLARRGHRPATAARYLRRPRGRQDRPARRLRARGRVPDRLPAPAQGVPHAPDRRCMPSRPVATRGLAKLGGTLMPTAPGTETEVLRRPRRGLRAPAVAAAGRRLRDDGGVVLVGERLATVPGALTRRRRPRRDHRRPARVGAPAGRRARCARGRRAADAAARRSSGRRCRGPRRGRRGLGRRRAARHGGP